MISQTATGLMGEYLAASAVLQFGYRVSMAQQDKVDLVCWGDDNEFFRVQVKTSHLVKNERRRSPVYHFQLGSGCKTKHLPSETDYDILCLVGAEHRRTLWLPVWSLRQYTKRVSPKLFDEAEAERASFIKAIEIVKEMRYGQRQITPRAGRG